MIEMFLRSVSRLGVRFAVYIGVGDLSTFKNLLDAKPYGDDLVPVKRECVGHVQKRMGTRLRNLKKKEKFAPECKFTMALIKELTIYYGLAIRRNPDSIEDMRREIWATYYHKISTDKNPQHEFCSSA